MHVGRTRGRERHPLPRMSLRSHVQQIQVLFEDTEKIFKVYLSSTLWPLSSHLRSVIKTDITSASQECVGLYATHAAESYIFFLQTSPTHIFLHQYRCPWVALSLSHTHTPCGCDLKTFMDACGYIALFKLFPSKDSFHNSDPHSLLVLWMWFRKARQDSHRLAKTSSPFILPFSFWLIFFSPGFCLFQTLPHSGFMLL